MKNVSCPIHVKLGSAHRNFTAVEWGRTKVQYSWFPFWSGFVCAADAYCLQRGLERWQDMVCQSTLPQWLWPMLRNDTDAAVRYTRRYFAVCTICECRISAVRAIVELLILIPFLRLVVAHTPRTVSHSERLICVSFSIRWCCLLLSWNTKPCQLPSVCFVVITGPSAPYIEYRFPAIM